MLCRNGFIWISDDRRERFKKRKRQTMNIYLAYALLMSRIGLYFHQSAPLVIVVGILVVIFLYFCM